MGRLIFDHADFDRRLLETLRAGQLAPAATEAIKSYGPEIYTLLVSIHHSRQDADDAFSLFCEKLWKGLAGFEGRSSFRTWAYTVAWSAASRIRARQGTTRRHERLVTDSEIAALAQEVRNDTLSRMRNERRSRLRELRQTLPTEDQLLLVLRVERELDWKDLARVMSNETDLDEATLVRESARLRKRYQALKERLREMIAGASSDG
jgi:RNA polymerase sigma-70 factor (ECF subfamily)